MRKTLIVIAFLLCASAAHAWFRLGDSSAAVFNHTGDRALAFAVTVTTGTAALVYSGTDEDREIFFQNTSDTYDMHCGTHSAVNDSAGTDRWILRAGNDYTSNGTYSVYCVLEDAAGATPSEVVGVIEFDRRD